MKENKKLRRRIDLTGKRYGRLVVIKAGIRRTPSRGMYWLCKCDCGVEKEITAQALKNGSTLSCGCYSKELATNTVIHGHNRRNKPRSMTYRSWDKMMQRCYNHNAKEYKWYGGRGISVHPDWHEFSVFLRDMGERKSKNESIDRIDVDGNYEPRNCRWATAIEQANNTQRNVFLEYNGEKKTIAELAREYHIKYDTLFYRIQKYGWSVKDAIETPVTRSNNKKRKLRQ